VALRGLAVSTADAFITPLGVTFIDTTGRSEIMGLAQVCANDQAHAHEHSLEVQLPFLQTVLTDFELLPLVVGQASPNEIAEVLDRCWGGDETLIVVSTDLSHYHAHSRAIELDGATAAAIARLDYEAIEDFGACGAVALRGLLLTASTRDLVVEQLDLRNSGDTAGDRDRVVGYGAFAVG
jgi:AmmeMemoRadiSam system protein B